MAWNPSIILTNTFGVYQGVIIAMTLGPMVTGNHKLHRKFWIIFAENILWLKADFFHDFFKHCFIAVQFIIGKVLEYAIFCFTRYYQIFSNVTGNEDSYRKLSIIASIIIVLLFCIFLQLVLQGTIIAVTMWPMITGNHRFNRDFSRILA